MTGSFVSWSKERQHSSLAARPQPAKPAAKQSPRRAVRAASTASFGPTYFAHLLNTAAPVVTIDRRAPPSSDANDFARRVLAADANTRGEKFDRDTFVDTPPPPPDRRVTARAVLRAVQKITGE